MARKRSWSINQLKEAARSSPSFRQVLMKLGLRETGGNYDQLRKYFKEHKIDTAHFRGQTWNKGLTGVGTPRVPLEKILVKRSYFLSSKLKKRLFTAGLKPKHCEQCGWAKLAVGGYLPLELDHINGDRHDNRIENLRVLCPNCHSLTPYHRGRRGHRSS